MAIKICPKCRSEDVIIDGSLITVSPNASICRNCGYKGLIFPEKIMIKKKK